MSDDDDRETPHEFDGVQHYFNTTTERLLTDTDPFGDDSLVRRTFPSGTRVGGNWRLFIIMKILPCARPWQSLDNYEIIWPEDP